MIAKYRSEQQVTLKYRWENVLNDNYQEWFIRTIFDTYEPRNFNLSHISFLSLQKLGLIRYIKT